jgi:hypothetical protein
MKEKNGPVLSRREFAQRAALLSATASFASAEAVFPTATEAGTSQAEPPGPNLSEAGKAEADSRYQQILALYGPRFDEAQKSELKKMCAELQPSLDNLRSYALQNGDAPALYLKPLVEREKRPPSPAATFTGEHS